MKAKEMLDILGTGTDGMPKWCPVPHFQRRVITKNGRRYVANSLFELEAALDESGPKTVQYYLIHRRPDGSDGVEEVLREYKVD